MNRSDLANNLNFEEITAINNAMDPIKLTVKALSREDASLASAEIAINFMYQKLEQQATNISLKFLGSLKERINDRKNHEVMLLLECLQNTTKTPTKRSLSFAQDLMKRLFAVKTEDPIQQEEEVEMSMQEELDFLISASHKEPEIHNDQFNVLKTEFTYFKSTGKRTRNLQNLYDALLSIKPTSTDVERVFSSVTFFCTKIRSRLSDSSLNALIFLKSYYRTFDQTQIDRNHCNR